MLCALLWWSGAPPFESDWRAVWLESEKENRGVYSEGEDNWGFNVLRVVQDQENGIWDYIQYLCTFEGSNRLKKSIRR
jgi:hypothetical protein